MKDIRPENLPAKLAFVLAEGEGQKIEFKRGITNLAAEMVAFANAEGGSIYIGVDDTGTLANMAIHNKMLSEIQDIATNCDPPLKLAINRYSDQVLEVSVPEGKDKPYRCKEGFFLRIGPNSQKLRRNEIRDLIIQSGTFHFDEAVNEVCTYPDDFAQKKFDDFLALAGIQSHALTEDILLNIDAAKKQGDRLKLTNAGILFFAREPQKFLKESYCTCVRYQGTDRFSIIDRQEIEGSPLVIIDAALKFVRRNISVEVAIASQAQHVELFEYPLIAVREAIINAVMHRDYFYDVSHIYIHIFTDRLEIESPGGLPPGLTLESIGQRSIRRNRLIADLLYRAGYIERIGSGIERMKRALADNNNPPLEISATNFFVIKFLPRIKSQAPVELTQRQSKLLQFINERKIISRQEAVLALPAREDTVLRELAYLQKHKLVHKLGIGKSTRYSRG